MQHFKLSPTEVIKLRAAHRKQKEKWAADRIKAIACLGQGKTLEETAFCLMLDTETLRTWVKLYRQGGLKTLCQRHYLGKAPQLNPEQQAELKTHCEEHTYLQSAQIQAYIKSQYNVDLCSSAVVHLLHRLGFSYRKPSLVPARLSGADARSFLDTYKALRDTKDPVYFIDGCHPQHQTRLGYGWISKGIEAVVINNAKPERLNIHGAVHLQTKKLLIRFEPTLNTETAKRLLMDIIEAHPHDKRVFVIGDNASYYQSKEMKHWLRTEQTKIIFVYVPPYCPHFNLIERVWKYFHRRVTHNHYYPEAADFFDACCTFFQRDHRAAFATLLTEKFHLWPYKGKILNPNFNLV